jgi:serine/threonine protein kinase
MEASETDMKSLIELGPISGFNEEHLKIIIYNTLCSLKFLHSCNVVHRDIKPANILINKNCQVMICDFGLARTMPESSIGKGSGNTKRVRDSIIKQSLKEDCSREKLKKIISNKLEA